MTLAISILASWLLGVIFFIAIVAGAEKQHRQERSRHQQNNNDRIRT